MSLDELLLKSKDKMNELMNALNQEEVNQFVTLLKKINTYNQP